MKAIISGVAGFIGSHMAERLLSMGYKVVGIDNLSRFGSEINLKLLSSMKGFMFHRADVRSRKDLDSIFRTHSDVTLVVHEAAQVAVTTSVADPYTDFEVNAYGTLNMLEVTRAHAPHSLFIYASTNKVYGELACHEVQERAGRYEYATLGEGVNENQGLDFHSPYGCSKGCGDQYVRDYARIFGLRTVVFRQSCIYGTRQWGMEDQGWIAWFTIAAILNRRLTIYGDGKQIRDVLWIDDLIDLYLLAWQYADKASGQIYNTGGGPKNTQSLLELIASLGAVLENEIPYSFSDWRPGDQRVYVSDCRKANADFGWEPAVSPSVGIVRLAEWVKSNVELIAGLFT
ncbi:GDP-mannose 4,6-dehydratase [Thermodesulfobacteriota bacterium]